MKLSKQRTETKPEFWTVQENCQNSTHSDQKPGCRHEPRRKGQDVFEENFIVTMDTLRISSVIITDSKIRSMHISIPNVIKTIRGKLRKQNC